MKFVNVTRDPNSLTRWEWQFWYDERSHSLILNSYATLQRPTKRHKFQVVEGYSRRNTRSNTMPAEGVILYPEVTDEAIATFIKDLKVVRTA